MLICPQHLFWLSRPPTSNRVPESAHRGVSKGGSWRQIESHPGQIGACSSRSDRLVALLQASSASFSPGYHNPHRPPLRKVHTEVAGKQKKWFNWSSGT